MAQRRMISLKIIDSARFVKMPVSCQLLYFHMAIRADDDGVVEGYNVMRMIGCTEDDLKVLVAKGFVTVLNEDLVAFINDWREHNLIRADRKVNSIYKDLLLQIVPHAELLEPRARADRQKSLPAPSKEQKEGDVPRTTNGQHRLGKDRLGKDSLGEIKDAAAPPSDDIDKEFENLWTLYPRKQGKANALKAYKKARKGHPELYQTVEDGIKRYISYLEKKKTKPEYIKQGSTWFNQRCWEDDYSTGGDGNDGTYKGLDKASRWGKVGQEF